MTYKQQPPSGDGLVSLMLYLGMLIALLLLLASCGAPAKLPTTKILVFDKAGTIYRDKSRIQVSVPKGTKLKIRFCFFAPQETGLIATVKGMGPASFRIDTQQGVVLNKSYEATVIFSGSGTYTLLLYFKKGGKIINPITVFIDNKVPQV